MALHVYLKEQKTLSRRLVRAFSYLSLIGGASLMFWAYYPVISFEIYSRLFITQVLASPIPESKLASPLVAAQAVSLGNEVFSSNVRDFIKANVWFPAKAEQNILNTLKVKEYTLTIPKLNIINAKVSVGGNDLSKSLIHYIPTSLPGEYGNVAIFGHSTLPQLYDVKNYKTIFTLLPSLEKGDKIFVNVSGQKYEYEVYEMFIVKPDHISVLEQRFDAAYLTLVTCVPPGEISYRLIIRAKLTGLPGS